MKTTIEKHWNGDIIKIKGKKVVNKSAYEIGLIVEGQAKLLCPRRYGYLAASYTTQTYNYGTEPESPSKYRGTSNFSDEVKSDKLNWSQYADKKPARMKIIPPNDPNEVLVGTPVEYGPYVEFGTVKMVAQPHLRPAFDLAKGKVLTIVKINAKYEFADYLFNRTNGMMFK
jgi:hypothetical protein